MIGLVLRDSFLLDLAVLCLRAIQTGLLQSVIVIFEYQKDSNSALILDFVYQV